MPAAVNNNDDATTRPKKTTTSPLHAEANRKCRKLEREKRLIERPQPGAQPLNSIFAHALIPAMHTVRHIPPRPPSRQHVRPLMFRNTLKNSSLESTTYRPSSIRKHKEQLATFTIAHPQLNTLISYEINTDLQIIDSYRTPAMFNQQPVRPLDVDMGARPDVIGSYAVSTP